MSAALEALIKYVNGSASAISESGYGRMLAGNNASEKIISTPETYDGRAHSNRLTKIEYDPRIYPNAKAAGRLRRRAAVTMRIDLKETRIVGAAPKSVYDA